MLNDSSSALSLIETRRSGRPREMLGPGPDDARMAQILSIAARVPDHGKLAPWRFVTVGDAQRGALEDLFLRALEAEDPEALPAKRDKAVELARSPGRLVVLVASPVANHKIPIWEQQLSCGAAAMNLLLAAHALGFVGGWVTGWQAYSPVVEQAFCRPGEKIAGFIFLGQPARPLEERPRPPLELVWREWEAPAV